jgi:aerobic carbon-monoxide dehydrogenase medium subunit
MYPSSFAYHRAESVEDAISRLESNPDAKILSGGHSLIPAMKLRLAMPAELVDISKLDDLKSISIGEDVRIGAGVTYQAISGHPELSRLYPILQMAIHEIGDLQVRARGTFGGALAHADPAADLTAVFVALNGRVKVQSSTGEREIAADELFEDLWTTTIQPNEILTEIILPLPAESAGMAYVKHAHPASGYAVVGVAAVITMEQGRIQDSRVSVTGATSRPERLMAVEDALKGSEVSPEGVAAAAAHAAEGLSINGDPYADEEYRAQLVRVLTGRALEHATAGQ